MTGCLQQVTKKARASESKAEKKKKGSARDGGKGEKEHLTEKGSNISQRRKKEQLSFSPMETVQEVTYAAIGREKTSRKRTNPARENALRLD